MQYKLMLVIEDMDSVDPVDFAHKEIMKSELLDDIKRYILEHPSGYSHYYIEDENGNKVNNI